MRRIRAAWAILACTALLCLFSHFSVCRTTASVRAQLSGIRAAAGAQEYRAAAQQAQQLLRYYDSRQHLLEVFLRRDTVSAVSVSLHGLPAYAQEETVRDLLSEIDKAEEQVRMLEHLFFSVF